MANNPGPLVMCYFSSIFSKCTLESHYNEFINNFFLGDLLKTAVNKHVSVACIKVIVDLLHTL